MIPFPFPFGTTFTFNITASQTNVNLRTLATAAGYTGRGAVIGTLKSGVTLSSSTTATAALVRGSFSESIKLIIESGAIIRGKGGAGSTGSPNGLDASTHPGSAGGTGVDCTAGAIFIDNLGTIQGGGGGGGGGGACSYGGPCCGFMTSSQGGNGGAGAGPSAAVAGSAPQPPLCGGCAGSAGGNGGDYGTAGSSADGGTIQESGRTSAGGAGGAAGNYATGSSNITWISNGTRTGPAT